MDFIWALLTRYYRVRPVETFQLAPLSILEQELVDTEHEYDDLLTEKKALEKKLEECHAEHQRLEDRGNKWRIRCESLSKERNTIIKRPHSLVQLRILRDINGKLRKENNDLKSRLARWEEIARRTREEVTSQQESIKAYKAERVTVHNLYETAMNQNAALDAKVKALVQGQDFRSTQEIVGRPHRLFQEALSNIHLTVKSLIKSTFRVRPMLNFAELSWQCFPDLGAQVSEICRPDFEAPSESLLALRITATDMLQAVVGHLIYKWILIDPFFGCNPEFHSALTGSAVLSRMKAVNERATRSWEAHCLRAYYSASNFEPFFNSQAQREEGVTEHCLSFTGQVLALLKPLYAWYDQQLPTHEEVLALVKEAAALSRQLAFLEAGLSMMTLEKLENAHTEVFSSWADVRNNRDGEEPTEPGRPGTIAMILYPGLLKIGRDNGSNWEEWSVWNKAKVAAFRPEPIAPQQTAVGTPQMESGGHDLDSAPANETEPAHNSEPELQQEHRQEHELPRQPENQVQEVDSTTTYAEVLRKMPGRSAMVIMPTNGLAGRAMYPKRVRFAAPLQVYGEESEQGGGAALLQHRTHHLGEKEGSPNNCPGWQLKFGNPQTPVLSSWMDVT